MRQAHKKKSTNHNTGEFFFHRFLKRRPHKRQLHRHHSVRKLKETHKNRKWGKYAAIYQNTCHSLVCHCFLHHSFVCCSLVCHYFVILPLLRLSIVCLSFLFFMFVNYLFIILSFLIPSYAVSGQNKIGRELTLLALIQCTVIKQQAVNNNWLWKLQPAVILQSWQKFNLNRIERD